MKQTDRIYVAGHTGMVGSAIIRTLMKKGFQSIITATHNELDLLDYQNVYSFFKKENPDIVFLAAAKVGGIKANRDFPVEFLYENLVIQNNVMKCCHEFHVKKLIFLGSSCIYPAVCPQPIKEEYLMTGPLEPTNEGYALAKIAGIKLAQYYHKEYGMGCFCPMPCNLYGRNDCFDPDNSHVLAALVKKFVDAVEDAKDEVLLWGSGQARREFLHVDDLAEGLIFLVKKWNNPDILNIGSGTDISIKELADLIAKKVSFSGNIIWDTTMPDGMLRKCLDVSKMKSLGFKPKIPLETGIEEVIAAYLRIKRTKIIDNKNSIGEI